MTPDGWQIACGGDDGIVRFLDQRSGQITNRLIGHGYIRKPAFSSDGGLCAAGTVSGDITVWEVPTGRVRARFRAHVGFVDSVSISSDGSRLASVSYDAQVRVWRLPPPESRPAGAGSQPAEHTRPAGND
ncbi:MAG: hypothetical protein HY718_10695 [Planctomycetes bacterium]|nr:hypothetical protein [Planctomycetota bacterium]